MIIKWLDNQDQKLENEINLYPKKSLIGILNVMFTPFIPVRQLLLFFSPAVYLTETESPGRKTEDDLYIVQKAFTQKVSNTTLRSPV